MDARIAIVFGTRPELIKMAPVIAAAKARGAQVTSIFTGQHPHLVLPLMKYFGIDPSLTLDTMAPGQDLSTLSARVLQQLDGVTDRLTGLDALLVQGDTTSATMAAYWSFCRRIPVGHVEAGLRTYDLTSPFPEEANRQLISRLAQWHFAPTDEARDNLLREGIPAASVHVVGNTAIDALHYALERADFPIHAVVREAQAWRQGIGKVLLITAHRRENFGAPLRNLAAAVRRLHAQLPDLMIIWPVHPNPNVREVITSLLPDDSRIRLTSPLDYHDFVWAMRTADLIVTDSGGVQEEAPSLGVPILVFRDNTERPEGVTAGCSELVGGGETLVTERSLFHLQNKTRNAISNPYGDGTAAVQILDLMTNPVNAARPAGRKDSPHRSPHLDSLS